MQLSLSFVALSVLSFCAASVVPQVTPVSPAAGPGPTDALLPPVPDYIVAEYLASLNSTGLAKRNLVYYNPLLFNPQPKKEKRRLAAAQCSLRKINLECPVMAQIAYPS
ncbi:hypothetical protein C8J57DRAFT_1224756 [Mycena rebaudengoi]|nr:hypothetical protein C8J57DRAFT_1224756 [Mycena rebaudengoi]